VAVSIKGAGSIAAVRELTSDGCGEFAGLWRDRHEVLFHFPARLSVSNEYYWSSEIGGVSYETAGIADGTNRRRQKLHVDFGIEIRKNSQPFRLLPVTK
jgi:hypothetical protein